MQRNNGGSAACASCRHQRKRRTETCALAPFCPVERNREFKAVHKYFGVSNVTKIVNSLNNIEDRHKAVEALVWEAFCRQSDPILGSYGVYMKVLDGLKWYQSQYHQIGLKWYKSQYHQINKAAQLQAQTTGLMKLASTGGLSNNNNTHTYANNGNVNGNNISGIWHANYSYSSVQNNGDKFREETRDNGSVILPQPQALNGLITQQYCQRPGQYAPIDNKQLDWNGSS